MVDTVDEDVSQPYDITVKLANTVLTPDFSGVYSFEMPAENVTLSVKATTKLKYSINSNVNDGDIDW
jgi:hypothetical protein